jgi:N-acetylmuramoyl-L-alanine amidase
MGGVRNYFESTPPPGTWFAAEAARRNGTLLASVKTPDATGPAASADASVRDLHRVARGESLGSIARQYGVSVGALKSANGISGSGDTLRAGAVLTIPAG